MGKAANVKYPIAPDLDDEVIAHIREAVTNVPNCVVHLKRWRKHPNRSGDSGQWITVQGLALWGPMPTADLINIRKSIEDLKIGGGKFQIDARPVQGNVPEYVARFRIELEGAPLVPAPPPGMPGMPPGMMPPGYPQPNQPGAPMQYPPNVPFHPYYPSAPGASVASDRLAMSQVADLKSSMGRLETLLAGAQTENQRLQREMSDKLELVRKDAQEAERRREDQHRRDLEERDRRERDATDKHTEEMRRLQEDQRRAEDRARDDLRRAEDKERDRRTDERFAAMSKKPEEGVIEKFMLLQATESRADRRADADRALKSAELERSGAKDQITTFMKMQEMTTAKSEAVTLEMLKQKSPDALSNLMGAQMEMQMTMAGAMMNLVQAAMPENPPPWLEVAMTAMGGIRELAGDFLEDAKAAKTPQQIASTSSATAAGTLPADAPTNGAGSMDFDLLGETEDEIEADPAVVTPAPVEDVEAAAEAEIAEIEVPDGIERAAVAAELDRLVKFLPDDFKTQDWRKILIDLHMQLELSKMADLLARHIAHCIEFDRLPSGLADLPTAPYETLKGTFRFLPVARKHPEYVEAVVARVVRFLGEEGYVKAEVAEAATSA